MTVVPGVPTMWVAFAALADAPADAFATVRLAYSGAARLPLTTMQRVADRFGVTVAEGYGLTEASPIVTSSAGLAPRGRVGGRRARRRRAAGRRRATASDVLVGDAGEIWVRGANVFKGYSTTRRRRARVLTPDGWLRTGDIGYCDDDGRLYLVDRAKDLIIVSGLQRVPRRGGGGARRAPRRGRGRLWSACPTRTPAKRCRPTWWSRREPRVDEDELVAFARDRLARYKCPSKVVFVDELPRNAAGKLVRRQLAVGV